MRVTSMLGVVLLAGCTLPQVVPEALVNEYVPTGEVQVNRFGASFDAVRVRSPQANLAKRTDGSWGGVLNGEPVDVSVTDGAVRGVYFTLSRSDSSPDKTVITGQWKGGIYRFELGPEEALIRTPKYSLTFPGRAVQGNDTLYGPRGELRLSGEAGTVPPAWPQTAFALVAAFTN